VVKKPRTRGGYSPARGLQNTNPQWVVAPVEEKIWISKEKTKYSEPKDGGHYLNLILLALFVIKPVLR